MLDSIVYNEQIIMNSLIILDASRLTTRQHSYFMVPTNQLYHSGVLFHLDSQEELVLNKQALYNDWGTFMDVEYLLRRSA